MKRGSKCGARLTRYNQIVAGENNANLKVTDIHIHVPDPRKVEQYRLSSNLKRKALTEPTCSRQIVGEISADANIAVKPILPSVQWTR